ncbi:MAG: Serine/threonine-protein kinase PknB, partial [Myxococcaceae bacterium]|nr:Serine/threonine-protein kinase PknB [Myxococcaceae bacterium]
MSQQAERRVGTIIGGKWRVDALLGSGSMAAVYAVTHRNGARAALKILHPTLCTDPAVCERFLGEGYLANSVKHSGIVRVLDDGVTDDGCVFLTMDLLEGDTLE